MKQLFYISAFLIASTLTFPSCHNEYDSIDISWELNAKLDTITFGHSMKGWELYSWQTGSNWKYSILIGTNAVKTIFQIKNNPISVIGEDSLKALLSKMPKEEEIFWIGQLWLVNNWQSDYENIDLPPRIIQLEIKEFCDTRDLKLTIEE